jgi:hypothetical protein
MNGIFFDVTAWLFALQGGQLQPYSVDVAAAIGGYGLGAVVAMADGAGYWQSTAGANITDPDAGGAGWQPLYAYGWTSLPALTGGSYTLSAVEASRDVLNFSGTLVANQQVVLPASLRSWLIVNECVMGAFSLTVKTAAGTGIEVPTGGAASPTLVYCDGANIQRVFVPSALPTSVAPAADTIVLRDNTARQFALTAPVGTSTTQVASTAFVNPGTVLGTDGYRRFPDGSMVQWGQAPGAGANRTVSFPLAFPSGLAPYSITLTPRISSGDALGQVPTLVGSPVAASFVFAPADGSVGTHWTAWGRWSPP